MHGTKIKILKNRELHLRTNDYNDDNYGGNNKCFKKLKKKANSDYLNYLTRQWTTLHQCGQQWQKTIHKETG